MATVHPGLAVRQPGVGWVFGNVALQAVELRLVADEVIKGILLPEAAFLTEAAIDLRSGEVLPRLALLQHGGFPVEGGEQVDVVWHDDEVEHLVAVAMKVEEAILDDLGEVRLAQDAGTMAGVEVLMPFRGEAVVILGLQLRREVLHLSFPTGQGGIDPLRIQPAVPLRPPGVQDGLRQGVEGAPSEEDDRAVLRPVRQLPLGDEDVVMRVKEAHGGRVGGSLGGVKIVAGIALRNELGASKSRMTCTGKMNC